MSIVNSIYVDLYKHFFNNIKKTTIGVGGSNYSSTQSFPRFNITQLTPVDGSDDYEKWANLYVIQVALAGYKKEDIDVKIATAKPGHYKKHIVVSVNSVRDDDSTFMVDGVEYKKRVIDNGITKKSCVLSYLLDENDWVVEADFKDGILSMIVGRKPSVASGESINIEIK